MGTSTFHMKILQKKQKVQKYDVSGIL